MGAVGGVWGGGGRGLGSSERVAGGGGCSQDFSRVILGPRVGS